jgi:hypothetical protein
MFSMQRSRFTDQQIALALQPAEPGTPVAEVTRKMGISEESFYTNSHYLKVCFVSRLITVVLAIFYLLGFDMPK